MPTAQDFRRIALSMPDASEGEHMHHPDFRANGRIFATLHPDGALGMVKVSPDEQRRLLHAHPEDFVPVNGAWGRQGCTHVHLATVTPSVLRDAMTLAWEAVMMLPRPRSKARSGTKAKAPQRKRARR